MQACLLQAAYIFSFSTTVTLAYPGKERRKKKRKAGILVTHWSSLTFLFLTFCAHDLSGTFPRCLQRREGSELWSVEDADSGKSNSQFSLSRRLQPKCIPSYTPHSSVCSASIVYKKKGKKKLSTNISLTIPIRWVSFAFFFLRPYLLHEKKKQPANLKVEAENP